MQQHEMANPFIAKLGWFSPLSREGHEVLRGLTSARPRRLLPGEDIIGEGERPRAVNILVSGWACRCKQLTNGRRQIISLILPGDTCEHVVFVPDEMDHSIIALSPSSTIEMPQNVLDILAREHPHLALALKWEAFVGTAVQREWTVNLGQRTAVERMAHLFCELFVRLQMVGLAEGQGFAMPLTQGDLADALGLSTVHVNRTLQELRGRGLLNLRNRHLTILDFDVLSATANFNRAYLHLSSRAQVNGKAEAS